MNIPVRRYLTLLARYLKPEAPKMAVLAALLATITGLQLYAPQVLRRFLDTAAGGGDGASLSRMGLLFIAIAIIGQVVTALARYLSERVSWTATNALRADLADHCLRLDLGFHKARTPGEMIERIDGDVTALSNFFSQMLIDVVANLVLMGGVLLLLFREDWRAGLVMTAFALFTLWVMGVIRAFVMTIWGQYRQFSAEHFGFLGEALAGTEAIRSSGAAGHIMHRYLLLIQRYARALMRAGMAGSLLFGPSLALFALGTAVALGLGAWLHARGAITVGTVYLIFHYTELLHRPIEQIRTQLQDLQQAGAAIDRVEELFALRSQIQDGPGVPIPAGPLSVELDQVTFGYEPGDPVLQDIDLILQPGEVLGLLGRTGSGKSTLARLLLRFYDPTAGRVRLGGVDLRDASLAAVRRRVGFVTQDVQLFAATVRENLTFFDASVPDQQIMAVLEELGLGPWMRALPQGLDTPLESGGGGLSAGEAQLLAFARVFLSDPGLVILDEASSRLDPATEALVERAVGRLLTGRTGIIIAHRLATVQRADTVCILEDGQALEHGLRTALANDEDSRFARLLRAGMEEVLA